MDAAAGLFGRETELESVARLLEDTGSTAALVIEGEAGIGKTTLWSTGVELAARSSWRVLSCRPTISEAELAFAAVADLLEPVAEDTLPLLPAPQRHALAAALLIEGPPDAAPSSRAIAAGVLSVLLAASADERLLLAIDDSQWLDPASAAALAYAVRRLPRDRVALLETVRTPHAEPLELETRLPLQAVERLTVGPLDVDALHTVVRARLDVRVPRPTMLRVHEISGGNPFYAVEIVRTLPQVDGSVAAQDIAIPRTLLALVEDRLAALEPSVQETLAGVASLASPTIVVLERAISGARGALAVAERMDVVEVAGDRVRFSHPLLAGAALELLPSVEQADLHLRLAEALVEPEERALHLALGTLAPDERIAREVADAAAAAARRGGTRTAAELAEHAVRLTPPDLTAERAERSLAAAGYEVRHGDIERARAHLEPLLATLPPGSTRAAALLQLARLSEHDPARALELCAQAIAEGGPTGIRAAEAHQLAAEMSMHSGDVPGALEHARIASRLAQESGDAAILVESLGTQAHYETYTGSITPGLLERAVEVERDNPRASNNYSPREILGLRLMYADRLDEARAYLEASYATAVELGDELDRASLLVHLTQLECRAGRLAAADRHARETAATLDQAGFFPTAGRFVTALVGAHLGRVEEARSAAIEGAALAEEGGNELFRLLNDWALGFLELSLDDAATADRSLRPLPEALEAMGYRNPGVRPVYADAIEALVGVGELDRARELAETLVERGRELDNPWASSTGRRGLGLVTAAEGRTDDALLLFEEALTEHERSQNPFERGRTLFSFGVALRRSKRRADARARLTEALDIFDHLGAALWSERATAELARIPGRTKASSELTETERRVAELVAEGLSNKEIAARLFVTVRTVEANLTKVYAKLGIHSRTELASRLHS